MHTGTLEHLGAGHHAVSSGPATVRAVCEVRGPDGQIKGTFTVTGTTELSATELREAFNFKEEMQNGSHSH